MEWQLTFRAVGNLGKARAISKSFLVTPQTKSSTLLAELLLQFASHASGLEFAGAATDEDDLQSAPRILLEDAITSLQQDQPLSLLCADANARKASLAVVGSLGSRTQLLHPAQQQNDGRAPAQDSKPVKKGRIQAKLGQSTTAGTNKVLDLAATRFTGHLCSLLLQRDEGFLHPYKSLQNQQEWVVALFMELCKSSPSCSDIDSDLVRKKVSK
jgi:hypothetical protein